MDNPEKNWQNRIHRTKTNQAKTEHIICRTPLYASKHK